MNTFRFFDFPVYQLAKGLYQEILSISGSIDNYSLKDQIRRASLSIVLNIAEGSAKQSDKDFARYLQIALGSINETVACLDIMKDNRILSSSDYARLLVKSDVIAKQLGGFVKKLYC